MNNSSTQSVKTVLIQPGQVLTYHEVVEYLDSLPVRECSPQAVERMAQLNTLCNNVLHTVNTVLVGGSNGKSLTMHFSAKLFIEENVTACLIYSTHFLTYNERIVCNGEQISNKAFTEVMNKIIASVTAAGIAATAHELVMLGGFLYAIEQHAEVAIVEVALGGKDDVSAVCKPRITVVTRVGDDATHTLGNDLDMIAKELVTVAQAGSLFISAEQSKIRLQRMKTWVEERGGVWAMPIRKLAPLPYMYEQLYGRTASLGERITQLYIETVLKRFSPFLRGNLLATQEGQRGRPTLEAKRNAEVNPIKTMKSFWKNQFSLIRGRFEVLDKEKPVVVLDNASNIDAFMNVFLGARLMHYQRPVKGFVMIMGVAASLQIELLLKSIRYLLKKVPGEVVFIPLHDPNLTSHAPEELLVRAREMNIRARSAQSLTHALQLAKEAVDTREGLVVVTGAPSLVTEYWHVREMKKL
jgi:dihydrofolate synthase/folylpolyglutamate synthase